MMRKRLNIAKSIFALGLSVSLISPSFSNWNEAKLVSAKETASNSITIEDNDLNKYAAGKIDTKNYDYLSLNEEMESVEKKYYSSATSEELYELFSQAEYVDEGADKNIALPSSIDLSQTKYFPPIGDQGSSGSCWHYSNVYYCLSYENNRKYDITATLENTLNPIFGYSYGKRIDLVNVIGYPNVGTLPINTKNTTCVYPTKEVWENAVLNRSKDSTSYDNFGTEDSVIEGPKDSSLDLIKQKLNEERLVSVCSYSYNWNMSVVASGEHKGEVAIDRCDLGKTGGHVITFVGYDDDIWIDINYDGKVQQAELGAFKMANSWGADWANDGFVWVAYDSLNTKSQILTASEQTRINAAIDAGTIKANKVDNSIRREFFMFSTFAHINPREKRTSDCLIYMDINTGSRREMEISVTATKKSDGTKKTFTLPELNGEETDIAWDGTTYSTDGTLVFDLDNVIPNISGDTMEDYKWEVTYKNDTVNKYSLTVRDLYFKVNGSKKYVTNVSKVPLNGSSKTYTMNLKSANVKDPAIETENSKNVILYYANSNYKDANIHYKIGSGSWTSVPGVQMCTTNEQSGYMWKYVINMGSSSSITLCFNENNAEWDSNGGNNYVISKAGCYGIKNGSINTLQEIVVTEEPTIELESTNISMNLFEIKDMKVTVEEADVSDIIWTSSDENIVMVSSTGKVVAVGEGSATIKATIGKVSASCTVTVTKEAEVKASAIKLDKSSVNLKKGDVTKFVATVTGKTNSKVDWTCSNENVAIVSGTGKMAAIGVGTATITASIDGLCASCKVTVSESQVVVTKPTVTVSAGDKQATVKWNTVSGATKYQVCSHVGGKYTVQVNNYTGTSYTVTGLANGTKYGFLVRAYINGAWTSYSTADLVYATPVTSTKPVVTVTPGSGQVTVKWNTVSGATKYQVCSYVGGKYTVQINNYTGTSYTVTGLTKGTKYGFLVRAYVNGAWTSYSTVDLVYATPS